MSFALLLSARKKKSILSPQSVVSKSPIIYELSDEESDSQEDKENNFQGIRYLPSIFIRLLYVIIVLSEIIY
jgi:hypothetical protein